MPKIYLYKAENGLCCMTDDEVIANDAAIHSGFDVYALDVEEHVPPPPKAPRWVVANREGASLHRRIMCVVQASSELALSYTRESDAVILKDVLTRGGMTGLTVLKIEE